MSECDFGFRIFRAKHTVGPRVVKLGLSGVCFWAFPDNRCKGGPPPCRDLPVAFTQKRICSQLAPLWARSGAILANRWLLKPVSGRVYLCLSIWAHYETSGKLDKLLT